MNPPFIWEIDGGQDPVKFLEALNCICKTGDKIVFGGYDTSCDVQAKLRNLGATMPMPPKEIRLNTSCYNPDAHRNKWPHARAFELIFSAQVIDELKKICLIPNGGGDKNVFYDDFVAYRTTPFPVPLIDFNCATSGGGLCCISSDVPFKDVELFSQCFGMVPRCIKHPPDRS
jgi:hypothetical protein